MTIHIIFCKKKKKRKERLFVSRKKYYKFQRNCDVTHIDNEFISWNSSLSKLEINIFYG